MDTRQINSILKDVKHFKGTFARNKMPTIRQRPSSIIINTDSSSEDGEHWVAMYFNRDGVCEYFDSLGFPPLHQIFYEYIDRNSTGPLIYSCAPLQQATSQLCGTYCIEFILARSRGESFKKFIGKFSRNQAFNDKLLEKKHTKYTNI